MCAVLSVLLVNLCTEPHIEHDLSLTSFVVEQITKSNIRELPDTSFVT
jgi:hypothetical protein